MSNIRADTHRFPRTRADVVGKGRASSQPGQIPARRISPLIRVDKARSLFELKTLTQEALLSLTRQINSELEKLSYQTTSGGEER